MRDFSSDRVVGTTENVQQAKEKAESVWIEIYGKEKKRNKPYEVFYDEYEEVWLVMGTLPPKYSAGGVPYILIKKSDGKVLAVWHDR
ncbi:MAG: YbbC/YhhH family protein [Clostridiales bacterium]|nr:YbbC/YhhH family protein [Clostridiales bacterium]